MTMLKNEERILILRHHSVCKDLANGARSKSITRIKLIALTMIFVYKPQQIRWGLFAHAPKPFCRHKPALLILLFSIQRRRVEKRRRCDS